MTSDIATKPFSLSVLQRGIAAVFILLGAAALAVTFRSDPHRAWVNVLVNNLYFLYFALAGGLFIAIQHVSKAGWSVVVRRVPEAMTSYFPVAAVIMLILFAFGLDALYPWTDPEVMAHDHLLSLKAGYLNKKFFFIRFVIYFSVWIGLARVLVRNSLLQDRTGDILYTRRNRVAGVFFIATFAFSLSLASYDWVMSLEPKWYSTMFGVYNFATLFLHGLAAMVLIALVLRRKGCLSVLRPDHLHDLGKFIFGFSVFWAYIWFSQFMLIWYANIPEEVEYFARRWHGPWQVLFYVNLLNWLVPFFGLMMRAWKRNPKILGGVCTVLLGLYWLDLYLLVGPAVYEEGHAPFGATEIFSFLGFAGLFVLVVGKSLAKKTLVPVRDPYLDESVHWHQ